MKQFTISKIILLEQIFKLTGKSLTVEFVLQKLLRCESIAF